MIASTTRLILSAPTINNLPLNPAQDRIRCVMHFMEKIPDTHAFTPDIDETASEWAKPRGPCPPSMSQDQFDWFEKDAVEAAQKWGLTRRCRSCRKGRKVQGRDVVIELTQNPMGTRLGFRTLEVGSNEQEKPRGGRRLGQEKPKP